MYKPFFISILMFSMIFTPRVSADSGDLVEASGETFQASGELLSTSFQLSGEVALTVGEPLADIVVSVARGTGIILKDTAMMSMDVTTGVLKLANKPLAFSVDVLAGDQSKITEPRPIVRRVTMMTAGDALALMQAVESKNGVTDDVRDLMLSLDMDPEKLKGSVLMKEGFHRFNENVDDVVFAVNTGDTILMVSLEELEQATRTAQAQ